MRKTCGSCKEEKAFSEFSKNKSGKYGLRSDCKLCRKKSYKEWSEKNKEKIKQKQKSWYEKNQERSRQSRKKWRKNNADLIRENNRRREALLRKTKVANFTDKQVIEKYGTLCHICEKQIDMNAPRHSAVKGWQLGLHIDHVIPLSKNGTHTIENVRPSHGICNVQKNNNILL